MNSPTKQIDTKTQNLMAPRLLDGVTKRVLANQSTTSEALLAGARELVIVHAGDEYRLRLTSQGKLILTK